MILIDQYIEYVEQKVFPQGLLGLKKCQNATELTGWKKDLWKAIVAMKVQGEDILDKINLPYPQEESKDDQLTMPQRVYIEAQKLEDDKRHAEEVLKK